MAEYIKVLGQASGSVATAETTLNGFPDPNLEFYATSTSHGGTAHATPGPLFGHHSHHSGVNENNPIYYLTGEHAPSSENTTGRTNSIRFDSHNSNYRPMWRISNGLATTTKPYLKAGQPYTLSLWGKFTGGYHGYQSNNHWSVTAYNGSSWFNIIEEKGDASMHGNGLTYNPGWDSPVGNHNNIWGHWGRHYQTFTGQGGYFDFQVKPYNAGYNDWTYLHLDNISLIEGAIPKALLPRRPIDGNSGNPNALYTSPYTTRSEGWSGLTYGSPTVRKVTGPWVNLYVCPDNRAAVASSIVVSNIGSSSATYRIAVVKYGESLSHKSMIAFDHPIVQTSAETMTIGLSLAAGDKVIVQSDTDKVQFQLFGSELTVG
jgi:hypothetical protein